MAKQMGLTEDTIIQAMTAPDSDDFSPAEKAALQYADLMVNNYRDVTPKHYDELRAHFTEAQLVELGVLVAVCIGFDQLIYSWQLSPKSSCEWSAKE